MSEPHTILINVSYDIIYYHDVYKVCGTSLQQKVLEFHLNYCQNNKTHTYYQMYQYNNNQAPED
jgi:hypothetical protein